MRLKYFGKLLLSRLLSKHPQPTAMRRHLPLISTTQVPASGFKHEYQHFTVIITMRSTQHACGWAWGVWEQGYLGSKCLCFTSNVAWRCSIHQHEKLMSSHKQAKKFSLWRIPMRSPSDRIVIQFCNKDPMRTRRLFGEIEPKEAAARRYLVRLRVQLMDGDANKRQHFPQKAVADFWQISPFNCLQSGAHHPPMGAPSEVSITGHAIRYLEAAGGWGGEGVRSGCFW